jgi:hypothetical protein
MNTNKKMPDDESLFGFFTPLTQEGFERFQYHVSSIEDDDPDIDEYKEVRTGVDSLMNEHLDDEGPIPINNQAGVDE